MCDSRETSVLWRIHIYKIPFTLIVFVSPSNVTKGREERQWTSLGHFLCPSTDSCASFQIKSLREYHPFWTKKKKEKTQEQEWSFFVSAGRRCTNERSSVLGSDLFSGRTYFFLDVTSCLQCCQSMWRQERNTQFTGLRTKLLKALHVCIIFIYFNNEIEW